jgi:hypothetical protein
MSRHFTLYAKWVKLYARFGGWPLRWLLDRLWYRLTDDEKERAPRIPFRTLED